MIFSCSTGSNQPNNGAANYGALVGNYGPRAAEPALGRSVLRRAGILRNLHVVVQTPAGAGASWTVTLRVNGVNTALQVVIAGAVQTAGSDLVNNVNIAARDQVSMGIVPVGVPAGTYMSYSLEFVAGAQNMCILAGSPNDILPNGATSYLFVVGDSDRTSVVEADMQERVPLNGTLRNFYVHVSAAPGGGASWQFTLFVNGIATTLTVTIAGAAIDAEDIANDVVVNAGDMISLRCVPVGLPAALAYFKWNIEFFP